MSAVLVSPILPLSVVWTDKVFRRLLKTNPRAGLLQLGVEVPADVQVKTIASKGSPSDIEDASLLQFLLERDHRAAYFFLPSPRSPCAQQAVFGKILSRELDDPLFTAHLCTAAAAALKLLSETS